MDNKQVLQSNFEIAVAVLDASTHEFFGDHLKRLSDDFASRHSFPVNNVVCL